MKLLNKISIGLMLLCPAFFVHARDLSFSIRVVDDVFWNVKIYEKGPFPDNKIYDDLLSGGFFGKTKKISSKNLKATELVLDAHQRFGWGACFVTLKKNSPLFVLLGTCTMTLKGDLELGF